MWHALATADALHKLDVDAMQGLSTSEATERLAQYGPNELAETPPVPWWKLVLQQFDDLLVKMLLAAAAVSTALAFTESADNFAHALVEPFVILLILVLNAMVGVWQESNAEKAIDALKQYEPNEAEVRRDGTAFRSIRSPELVPGDIVRLTVGCRAPADLRLLELSSTTLRADQAILTGESEPTMKEADLVAEPQAEIQSRVNMVFSGTTIAYGSAIAVVVETGARTEMGLIGEQVASTQTAVSPLKQKLDEFGETLSKVIAAICCILWLINIGHFRDPVHGSMMRGAIHYFKTAIALAVAAIPEGLPAVVTTCLALGTRRMAARNAIVRYLPSVETLGTTGVICSDKTGTLTTGRMAVWEVVTVAADGTLSHAASKATGYDPTSEPLVSPMLDGAPLEAETLAAEPYRSLGAVCGLCNDAHIHYASETSKWEHTGMPTEAALRTLCEKLGAPGVPEADEDAPERASDYWRRNHSLVATLEFERTRKSMSVITCRADAAPASASLGGAASLAALAGVPPSAFSVLVKGAPESVLERCDRVLLAGGQTATLNARMREALNEAVAQMAGGASALRCLACAMRHGLSAHPSQLPLHDPLRFVEVETGLTFVGLVGLRDPPRPEVAQAIETCRLAGIRVVCITGDNAATAGALCRSIGVLDDSYELGSDASRGLAYTGREFGALDLASQRAAVKSAALFSRTEPTHKLQLVQLLQEAGEVVAMTGDGVNDAPALKKANIGVAMGSGTAVAKGAADMVLADDNFSTIVAAVEEGRSIFNNTQAFIRYLISSNIGEVACIFLVAALGFPEAMVPVQLLWVNLVTDGLPATALTMNPPDANVMSQPPRPLSEAMVDTWLFTRYMLVGLYVGIATVIGHGYWFIGGYHGDEMPISFHDLSHFEACGTEGWPEGVGGDHCATFSSLRPRTVALSILVTVEMLNALNALSQNESLLCAPDPQPAPHSILPIPPPTTRARLASPRVVHWLPAAPSRRGATRGFWGPSHSLWGST